MPPPDCVWAQRKDRLWLTLKIVGAREQDVALRFFGEGRVSLRATCESAYQLEPLVYEMELDLFAVRAPRPPPARERYSLRTASSRPARAFAAGGAAESWSAPLLLRPKKPCGCPVLSPRPVA